MSFDEVTKSEYPEPDEGDGAQATAPADSGPTDVPDAGPGDRDAEDEKAGDTPDLDNPGDEDDAPEDVA